MPDSPSARPAEQRLHGPHTTLQDLIANQREAQSIVLSPKRKATRQLAGAHQSRLKGRGMEFDDVRGYQPGDDVRNIDWRVTARTGGLYSKVFVEERERPVLIVTDFSPSMYFGTRKALKSVVAARLAALMAWYAIGRGDRVGGLVFSPINQSGGEWDIRPSTGRKSVLQLLQALSTATRHYPNDGGKNRLSDAMEHATRVARPGSLVLLLSDFSAMRSTQQQETFRQPLHRLAAHSDVIAFNISDPFEHQLPQDCMLPLSNGKQRLKIAASDERTRDRVRADFRARHAWLEREFGQLGQPVVPVSTTDKLVDAVNRPVNVRSGES
jgi:uncharacterized protein (DUF58 family)